jgi:glycosyltransferase involved in cell wall biosynthesis
LKWVSDLVEAYKNSWLKNELIIIWDWEEKNNLENISKWLNIKFLWYKDRDFIINYLSKNNCILVNPSYQEWMPTTVIEWLSTWCVIVASNVWGTSEISNKNDLVLFEARDKKELEKKLKYTLKTYNEVNWLSLELINEKFNWEVNVNNLYNLVK